MFAVGLPRAAARRTLVCVTDSRCSQLQVIRLPGRRGLRVIGDVDLSTRDLWRRALESTTPNDAPARLDLSRLSFIDARGAAKLVAAAQQRPETTPLTLTRPPAVLRRMLTLLFPAKSAKIVFEELEGS